VAEGSQYSAAFSTWSEPIGSMVEQQLWLTQCPPLLLVVSVDAPTAAAVLFGQRTPNSAEGCHNFDSSYTAVLFKSGFVVYCPRQDGRFIRQNIDDAGDDKERLPEHHSSYFSSFIIPFFSFSFVRFSFNFFPTFIPVFLFYFIWCNSPYRPGPPHSPCI
jgi:hypothetical protein